MHQITVPQVIIIHRLLSEVEERIFIETGHRLKLTAEQTVIPGTLTAIIVTTAQALNIPLSSLLSPTRQADVKEARQIAMFLCKKYQPGVPDGEIARSMGKDRTTVWHSVQYVGSMIKTNDERIISKLLLAESAVKKMIDENKASV